MKRVLSFVGYLFYLLLIVGVVLEIVLRVFNPIPVRLKGDKISLPINQEYSFKSEFDCFDSLIVHSKNNYGFRGSKWDSARSPKIVAVGGSTTECFFISDDKVWTQVLQDSLSAKTNGRALINNAGLNGHSTFGHNILLNDIILPLKPDYVLFLIGINDMDRDDLNDFDKRFLNESNIDEASSSWLRNTLLTLTKKSEVVNLIYNFSKASKARSQNIFVDKVIDLSSAEYVEIDEATIIKEVEKLEPLLESFRNRLQSLVDSCQSKGVRPVLLTQPLLYGYGNDPVTGADLAHAKVYDGVNGKLYWKKLEAYNTVTREMSETEGVQLIDLAKRLPKSSQYFYDAMHFTNDGSIKVGQIIYEDLEM